MKLSLQTFQTIVANSAAAVQSASKRLLDLSTGSVLRAILEANASIALWMQWLIVSVLRTTRASSSVGPDLDSWMADFGFERLPAAPSVGSVTFSRYVPASVSLVPPGCAVKTNDGSQSYLVVADSTNQVWDQTRSAYILNPGISSISIPVKAQTPGSAGNVLPGTITIIASPVAGIDTVINPLATTNGVDGEPDSAFRARFVSFINSRSRSTMLAIASAVMEVQQGLSYAVLENIDSSGANNPGNFVVVIDDGSGAPSATLVAAVNDAVERVRPIGSLFSVRAPVVSAVRISLNITLTSVADRSGVIAAITQKITDYVNGLPIGASLPITKMAQLAYDTDQSVSAVGSLQLNGQFGDISVSPLGVVKVASVLVT